jgi:hypothetical protein
MTHRIKKGDRIRLKVRSVFGWQGYGIAKYDQTSDDPGEVICYYREGGDPFEDHCIACRFEVARCRIQPKRSQFYSEALCITEIDDRCDRKWKIRDFGQRIYDRCQSTSALRELMETCIELKPDRGSQLMSEFNGALDGVGHWRA